MVFWHYTRIFARLLSLSVEENSIVMKLYLQLGLCIALSLLWTALSGPLTMEYNDEPSNHVVQWSTMTNLKSSSSNQVL